MSPRRSPLHLLLGSVLFVLLLLATGRSWFFPTTPPPKTNTSHCVHWIQLVGAVSEKAFRCLDIQGSQTRVGRLLQHLQAAQPLCKVVGHPPLPGRGQRLVVQGRPGGRCLFSLRTMTAKHRVLLGIPLSINVATIAELAYVPGLSPQIATRIVQSRQKRGRFQSVEDLRRVRGIGRKTLQRLRPYLDL